ncbi:MAG: aminopeptidase [Bacteroidales bacterium]|nr:aminopeptidase [Bacteroidales bacterium]
MKQRILISLFLLLIAGFQLNAQEEKSEFLKTLEAIEGVEVIGSARSGKQFTEAYELKFTQPVNHNYPTGLTFTQRMFIGHVGYDRPMVLSTSGYQARGLGNAEPAQLLKANLIRVEHRYFGESVPDPLIWDNLTVWQAATDHHRIVQTFKKLYEGKWVSTGHSKDGQTAIMFKAIYPDDIDVAIPYVAPLNKGKVDPRIYDFLSSVGTDKERQKVYEYQIAMFEKKDQIMPIIKEMAEKRKWNFTMGIERGYDLAVLEFPFAMWQYGAFKPMSLPGKEADPEELLKPFYQVNALFYFSEPGIVGFLPHYYQAMNEMGYYGYDVKPFQKYLPDTVDITWDFTLTPYGIDTTFNPNTLKYMHDFVQNRGDNMLYIYGEYDTWTATGVTKITGLADALVMIQSGGYHGSHITAFPEKEQKKIFATLSRWLEMEVPVK